MGGDVCARPTCHRPAGKHTRRHCEADYRRLLRMGLAGWRDAAPARRHVAALRELGWTYAQIAEAAGLSKWVPHNLATGRTAHVWPESERAILAVPLVPRSSRRGVDSAGTRRRVQALAWMGWPAAEVARRAGITHRALATQIHPNRRVSYALARRVAAVYDELSGVRGPSVQAAARARQLGHAPPAAWDEGEIDDPAAKPRGVVSR